MTKYNKTETAEQANKKDVYELVTNKIISKLEQGIIPWRRPWNVTGWSYNRFGDTYSLSNQFMLDGGEYASFKQWTDAGYKLVKGAVGEVVTFWKFYYKANADYTGEPVTLEKYLAEGKNGNVIKDANGVPPFRGIPVLKYFYVFNSKYVIDKDGKPVTPKRESANVRKYTDNEVIERAETVIDNYVQATGLKLIKKQSNQAYYTPSMDSVTLPLLEQFKNVPEYYSTAFHELTHSTGHPSRLNRNLSGTFGKSDSYSKEELTAEMGACFICSTLGIDTTDSVENTTAYIQSWLEALKNDKTMFLQSAKKAEKASDYILQFTPEYAEAEPEQEQPEAKPEQPEKKEAKKAKKATGKKAGKKEGKKAETPSLPELGKDAQKALVTLSKKRMTSGFITDGDNAISGDAFTLCKFNAGRINSETKAHLIANSAFSDEDRQAGSYRKIFDDVEKMYVKANEHYVLLEDFITKGLANDVTVIQPKSATHAYSLERIKLAKRIAGKDATLKEFADGSIMKPSIIKGNGVEILICPCRKYDD